VSICITPTQKISNPLSTFGRQNFAKSMPSADVWNWRLKFYRTV